MNHLQAYYLLAAYAYGIIGVCVTGYIFYKDLKAEKAEDWQGLRLYNKIIGLSLAVIFWPLVLLGAYLEKLDQDYDPK